MPTTIEEFVEIIHPKVIGKIKGKAKLVITDQGSVMVSETGAWAGDEAADVTLISSAEVFKNIFDGGQNPSMAFMSGKLKVEGSPTRALKVSAILIE